MDNTYSFRCSSEALIEVVTATLARRGLRVLRSFDLRSVLSAQSAQNTPPGGASACACPHHGTAACDCEYAVLLVYGGLPRPAVLIVHGRDGSCSIQLVEDTAPPQDSHFARQLLGALLETTRALLVRNGPAASPDVLAGAVGAPSPAGAA